MASEHSSSELASFIGFDPKLTRPLPDDIDELSNSSLKSFINDHFLQHSVESRAVIHVTGPVVIGHTVPIRGLGSLMTELQGTFDSIGASLSGFKSLGGSIPSRVVSRTELSLVASPLPGSVVLEVVPSMPRLEDLNPNGPELFTAEELGLEPLADKAFSEFSALLGSISIDSPNNDDFIDRLEKLGPRVASTVQSFCNTLDKSNLDVEFSWVAPTQPERSVAISHSFAKYACTLIEGADVTSEVEAFVGVLVTITTSTKDHIRIRIEDEDGTFEEKTFQTNKLDDSSVFGLTTGDRVKVVAERSTSMRAGGRKKESFCALSIERLPQLGE